MLLAQMGERRWSACLVAERGRGRLFSPSINSANPLSRPRTYARERKESAGQEDYGFCAFLTEATCLLRIRWISR